MTGGESFEEYYETEDDEKENYSDVNRKYSMQNCIDVLKETYNHIGTVEFGYTIELIKNP